MDGMIIADTVVTVAVIAGLVLLRIFKKFKKEKPKGIIDWVERNLVEILLGMVLIPELWGFIKKLFD